ncbi:MFS transporter [Sinorhizobium medicae]|uniref:MFS transporter n=1 Tax=Sinorhizobium medicae TaxID=110321 RepID=A0A508WTK2_9HYPH|nr:MFS transporter [Sinorhizobium medicae]MBO1960570.1 MFS transporter [Sinorhizobium medicae]WQO54205.1 MFS transporter [Sinorhizobium medicae]WQP39986.1 MFS transporter [Sinorhizobium medicae]VTZ59366.1 MFS transporter [Sinorhizobium medicae]
MGSPRIRQLLELAATLSGVIVYTSANGFMTGGLAVAGRQVGVSEIEVGAILGLGALVGVVIAPLWGYAAEIWSRRKLMLLAVPMITLGPAAVAIITAHSALLPMAAVGFALGAARLVQAAFGAASIPVAQAFIANMTTPDHRVRGMGGLSAVVSSGTLIGSALLWVTGRFGVATGFAAVASFGAAACVLVFAFLPDAGPRMKLQPGETALPLVRISPYLLITFVGFISYTLVPPIFALRLMDRFGQEGGTAAAQTGFVLTVGVLAVCIAQALIAVRSNWNILIMLRAGAAGILLGLVMLLMATDLLEMCIAMGVIGFSVGFIAPANLGAISLAAGRGAQGKVGGLNMAARGLGTAIGPVVGTTLYSMSVDAPIYGSLVLVGILLVMTFLVPARDGRHLVVSAADNQSFSKDTLIWRDHRER